MITVQAHYILKNPTQEKLVDLINTENINNTPLFIYTISNNEINPCHEGVSLAIYDCLYEFKHNDNTYYFFEQNVRKHLVYNTDMIPNLSNTHTLFVTNLLIA